MRILFVTPYVPSTVRIRPYAFLRELAQRGHEVTLACLVQPSREALYLPDVAPFCKAVYPVFMSRLEPYLRTLLSIPSRVPLSVAYCTSEPFSRLVEHLNETGNYDLIHTEFLRAAPVTRRLGGRPKVYDAVDSLTLAYRRSLRSRQVPLRQRALAMVEWAKMTRYEPSILSSFDRLLVSSPADRQVMEENLPGRSRKDSNDSITVIPNGVDLDYFQYFEGEREPATITFLGKMSYYVNISSVRWFYQSVFPHIRRQRPDARLRIVGRDPSREILALAADPAVEVTGSVPDVRPYLARSTVSICPMVSGAGIQNKMLEAMAVGTPTVATTLACQALDIHSGEQVMIADAPQEFAHAVLELLESPGLRQKLSQQGRQYVEACHTWRQMGERLNQVFEQLTQKGD